jgi:glycosyltransferase involved in cell wall biosynthesis
MQFKTELWSSSGRIEITREVEQDQKEAEEDEIETPPRQDLNKKLDEILPKRLVDVIVYYEDMRAFAGCVRSILSATTPGIKVRLLAARSLSSAEPIPEEVLEEAREKMEVVVSTSVEGGFSRGVDAALHTSFSPWFIVLSEHARVFDGWLNHLFDAVTPNTSMVSSLSNRSVPIRQGMSSGMMARSVASSAALRGHPVAFPMETCLLVNRAVLAEAGGLDTAFYAPGGGEFLELYLRACALGYEARLSERCWVFDESASRAGGHVWEPDSRKGFSRFISRHGDDALSLRAKKHDERWMERLAKEFRPEPCPRVEVVFVLREAVVCGLVLAITEICNALNRTGRWNAYFICTSLEPAERMKLPLSFEPVVLESEVVIRRWLKKKTGAAIIATITATAEDVLEGANPSKNTLLYFVQDDERTFRHASGAHYQEAEHVEKMWKAFDRRVVNAIWLKKVMSEMDLPATRIGIGVDTLRFHPGDRSHEVPRIMVHCRPSTPRRGWPFVSSILNRIAKSRKVDVITYDERPDGLNFKTAVSDLGKVPPWELAVYMSAADIFIEGSELQGWGMQSLEALSSGCALVSTDNVGVHEFGTPGRDCAIVPHGDVELAASVVCHLIDHPEERKRFSEEGRRSALAFSWDEIGKAWDAYLSKLFGASKE